MQFMKEGMQLLCATSTDGMERGNPNIQNVPISFEQVFDTFSQSLVSKRVTGTGMDFHGDGSDDEIDILEPTGHLLPEDKTGSSEHLSELTFIRGNQVRDALKIPSPSFTHPLQVATGGDEVNFASAVGVSPSAESNPFDSENTFNHLSCDGILNRQRAETITSDISSDYVTSVSRRNFAGHVFNLETEGGWYIANGICVSNCRPPGNRTPVWNESECCRPRRIKWIEQQKPKLIVGLGAIPLHWALGSSDLSGMRGRLFAIKVGNHSCWFMPTYHPSYILRTAYDKKRPLQSKLGHCLRMDIQRAYALVDGLETPHIDNEQEIKANVQTFDGTRADQFERLCELLDRAREAEAKSVDIETVGLRPFNARACIVSVAISFRITTFAFSLDHPQSAWSKSQRATIAGSLRQILRDHTTKIAHNAPFEIEWFIWLLGKDVVNHTAWECTQMQAHFLDERRGKQGSRGEDQRAPYQSLDFLCKQHFGFNFKKLFKVDKKDMSKSDLAETLLYNGVDAKYTLRLWQRQTRLLKSGDLHDAYLEALPRQSSVALMQTLGVGVDQAEVKQLQGKLSGEVSSIEGEISSLKVVRAFEKDHGEFNPLSNENAIALFRDYLHRSEVLADSDGRSSVDKNVLEQIDHPLAKLIVDLRNRTKLKSTYVDGLELGKGEFIYPDGKIHCNFNTTFAETGRTSSDGLNMQNFPQRQDAWVRKQIVAPKNHLFVAFDYGQLEGCTAAMCSRDKVLVEALWNDYDIHQEWAEKTAARYPAIGKPDKALRSRIKNKLVFPAIFGAQNKSIAGYLDVPEDIIDDLMDEFWATFIGLADWQSLLMKHYYEVGWVASPTGRRHHYPLTRNQAINHPIQSFACDIVCNAMNELSSMAVESGRWYLHPVLNIHDDLTFAIPDQDNIMEEAIDTIYRVMLSPPYKCVNVPLSVEASIGQAWFGMKSIGKFWSHRDL